MQRDVEHWHQLGEVWGQTWQGWLSWQVENVLAELSKFILYKINPVDDPLQISSFAAVRRQGLHMYLEQLLISELASVKLVTPATIIYLVYRMHGSESGGKCILVGTLAPFFVEMECNHINSWFTSIGKLAAHESRVFSSRPSSEVPLGTSWELAPVLREGYLPYTSQAEGGYGYTNHVKWWFTRNFKRTGQLLNT